MTTQATKAFFENPIIERLPEKGSAGASPYRGAFGRARLLPSLGSKKMRSLKHALKASTAFTLIELLIAVSIFAIVLAAINTVFFATIRLREKTSELVDAAVPVNRAVDIIKGDIAGIVQTGILAGAVCSDTVVQGMSQPVLLELFTTTGLLKEDGPWADVQKIDYWLQAPTNRTTGCGQDLIRGITRNLLSITPVMPDPQPLLQGVQRVKFSYFDGTNWTEAWNSTLMYSNTPMAIKMRVEFVTPRAGGTFNSPIQLVVPIPPPPPTNSVAQSSA